MNLGCSNSDKIQNAFTAYLLVALNRNVYTFTCKQNISLYETVLVDDIEDKDFTDELLTADLPIFDRLANRQLAKLLLKIPQKTREILYMKVFEELSIPQIAARLGLHTQKVSAIYYRTIKSLKKSLGGYEK